MKLLNAVQTNLSRCGVKKDSVVLCALSGGADSVCLLHLLLRCGADMGIRVAAAHLNHRIRGDEADRDEGFCRDLCERLGVPLAVGHADVPTLAITSGKSIEEAARDARYAFLVETAKNIAPASSSCASNSRDDDKVVIATAHHQGDNAETVLLNLTRGTGLSGLAGIPMTRTADGVTVVRPLLTVSRREIEEYLGAYGIKYILDSSNLDEVYARNRVRLAVLPLLAQIHPGAQENIARCTAHLREDLDFIEHAVQEALTQVTFGKNEAQMSAKTLSAMHPAIAKRVIAAMVRHAAQGHAPEEVHLCAVLTVAVSDDPSAETSLPGGVTAWRQYGSLYIGKKPAVQPFYAELVPDTTVQIPGFTVECKRTEAIYNNLNTFTVDCSKIHGILSVRPRREGDTIRPVGRGWTKSVKKAMIDLKIPRHLRNTLPVIDIDGTAAAVFGIGTDARYAATADTAADDRVCITITDDFEK